MTKQVDYQYREATENRVEVWKEDKYLGMITRYGKLWVAPNGYIFDRKYLASAFLDTDYAMTILAQSDFQVGEATVKYFEIVVPQEWREYSQEGIFVGIDPGSAKCGLTIINGKTMIANCFEIRFPHCEDMIHKMYRVLETFKHLRQSYIAPDVLHPEMINSYLVVEGADYGSVFGQADLATARTMETYAFTTQEEHMKILAPKKIRSITFKSGDKRAEEVWGFLPPNLASSLCCAISGLILFHNQPSTESTARS